ncbi:MAG: hypothetical protein VYE22_33530 [Myxococcota bacterium]|nr:hypothetical protein [Myxococcota bacterium]
MRARCLALCALLVACTEPLPGDVRNGEDAAAPDAGVDDGGRGEDGGLERDGGLPLDDGGSDGGGSDGGAPFTIRAIDVGTGSTHTCAVTTTNTVVCWGANDRGQLGRAEGDRAPGVVEGVSATSVCAGDGFTCALTTAGEVACWGVNNRGQLGRGVMGEPDSTRLVIGLSGVRGITCGSHHACALDGDTVDCWGSNATGQLGTGGSTAADPWPRTAVSSAGSDFTLEAGARHTCFSDLIRGSGRTACWGDNGAGQIEEGGNSEYRAGLELNRVFISEMALGERHTCFMTTAGFTCRGSDAQQTAVPTAIGGGVDVAAAGLSASCGGSGADVVCWGDNDEWQLGTSASGATQATVTLPSDVRALDGGAGQFCAIDREQRVWCWGANGFGQARPGDPAAQVDPAMLGL